MKELEYPFDAKKIIKNKKTIKRELLSEKKGKFLKKKIAILGGSTTKTIKEILEIFLLNHGIEASFYESEYNQYYADGMFTNATLEAYAPDVIYICTSVRNIIHFPEPSDDTDTVREKLESEIRKFQELWLHLEDVYHCPIIQNNFEYPYFRLLGNKEASDVRGRVNFVTRLNLYFSEYAQTHENFYICDINYLSAFYGLEQWSAPYYWYLYKYAVSIPAIPYLAHNVANIIKSIYGKNKKALNLDLDNTLWGGIVGEEGADRIEIGMESPMAQAYTEFQEYLKLCRQLGIVLTVNSKNEQTNAIQGLKHPDSVLSVEDFAVIRANWEPKSQNLIDTADELNLLPESFVFIDDSPAERALIEELKLQVSAPEIGVVEDYIKIIDQSGFFETTSFSEEDLNRAVMYQQNVERNREKVSFVNYEDYLKSLEMQAEIQRFVPVYMSRIAQLTNKSNQFNLTLKRYSQSEIEFIASNSEYLTLYGKLEDKFGDNGVVSVIIGKIKEEDEKELHVELWLMSCRVFKRDMEYAMMDRLVEKSQELGIRTIIGYYYPAKKNNMVKDFYQSLGFIKISESESGETVWKFEVRDSYMKKQDVIRVKETE